MRLLSCKETTALVSQGLDRKLSLWERCALRIHLLVCDACRNFVRQSAFIRRAVRRLAGHDDA
ncbi:MAG TPA: zf-HC2 domain-containing protein [Burkholderiales bacterium]|nr:zf-HC2 domain-containing protein [Burkholderiales bacterium]